MIIRLLKKLKVNRIIYRVALKFSKDKETRHNIKEAIYLLEQFSPDPKTSCLIPERPVESKQYDLDIIVPAYNVEQYIGECLNSVLSQSTKWSYRVIVINDGSTDRTGQIIDTYKEDKRVKIIHQKNRGFSGARNRGLDELDSKYVTFLDSDDILMPHAIESFLDKAFEFDAAVVETGFSYISQAGKTKRIEKHKGGLLDPKEDLWGFTCGKILKSDLFTNIRFPEKFWFEDSIMKQIIFPIVIRNDWNAYGIEEPLYCYRNNQNGISRTSGGRRKSIDTVWITLALYQDRNKLGLKNTQAYYEDILDMVKLSYTRTKRMPQDIQKAVFTIYADFIKKNLSGFRTKKTENRDLEMALYKGQFKKYKLFCDLF